MRSVGPQLPKGSTDNFQPFLTERPPSKGILRWNTNVRVLRYAARNSRRLCAADIPAVLVEPFDVMETEGLPSLSKRGASL
ncbi:hypothetical protein CDAR_207381 [Caerostris darwini]|uniref:Uncharacterized protein n=1 Tax=Caerostris darwini TaxID=1538125 RepID=A0AAV4VHJ8_9ARAC|nr:hypothetical protein CDAR_207381 [Caerostris darwini]